MKSRRLVVEPLENRTLLAADVATEIFPQEPLVGDANQDGAFDQSDLIQVLEAGKYLTGEQAVWSEGDWNGDGTFNELDLVFAFQAGNYGVGIAAQGYGQAIERHFYAEGDAWSLGFTEPPPDRCPADYVLSTYEATYQAKHLGRTTATATHCVDLNAPGFPVVPVEKGEYTFIAANGDELYATYEGGGTYFEFPMVGWTAEVQFTGGTGRFSGATGTATEVGEVNIITTMGSATIDGAITYNASDRRG